MRNFKLTSIRVNQEEFEIIQDYKIQEGIDIAVLVRDIIKEILLKEYSEIEKIVLDTNDKYPQKISVDNNDKSMIRDKNFKIRLDYFLGEIFKEICQKNNLSYTSILRGLLFEEIYK